MLSAHTILVAAIFTAYMASMAGLFAYICSTAKHPDREDGQDDGERGDDLGDLLAAA